MTSVIKTSTTWEDTGYDCDHCGGRILKRLDRETGQPDRACFQCEACSCQWTLDRRPLRVGTKANCRVAQRDREAEGETPAAPYARWLLWALGALVLFVLLRFGGATLVRLALPVVLLGVLIAVVVRVGKQQGWWRDRD